MPCDESVKVESEGPFLVVCQSEGDPEISVYFQSHLAEGPSDGPEDEKIIFSEPVRISKSHGGEDDRFGDLDILASLTDVAEGHQGLHEALESLLGQAFDAGRRFEQREPERETKTPIVPR